MLLSQIINSDDTISVVVRNDSNSDAYVVNGVANVYELAIYCIDKQITIIERINELKSTNKIDLHQAYQDKRFIAPIQSADNTHLYLTGTGLTHLGSADTRDKMHIEAEKEDKELMTDSKRMFLMGVENGKPSANKVGVQPEWFYKGNGNSVVNPGSAFTPPEFALDSGEEPELAGLYIISKDGIPFRVGYALANEFSDHKTEQINYLYLAHSKLRQASFGPEIFIGDLPKDIQGHSRIYRNGKKIFDQPFVTGEQNMSHALHNLEHHHFKYDIFCHPGDVHIHMFGTATLSFAQGIETQDGDVFEIEVDTFGLPLRNQLTIKKNTNRLVEVKVL